MILFSSSCLLQYIIPKCLHMRKILSPTIFSTNNISPKQMLTFCYMCPKTPGTGNGDLRS